MPETRDWIGLAMFVVMLIFVILAWRAGKRQFRAYTAQVAASAVMDFKSELAAFATAAANVNQTVTVVQGESGVRGPAPAGAQSGGVLDGVHGRLSSADGETAELERLCIRYGLDIQQVKREAERRQLVSPDWPVPE